MKKILIKKQDDNVNSILDIVYDDKFTDLVKITLIEEKTFYKLRKKSIDEYIEHKIKKDWISAQEDEVIDDPIFGFIMKDEYGYLYTSKYLDSFKKNVYIVFGNIRDTNLKETIKNQRTLFCDFINHQDELIVKIQNTIYKYAKESYKELIKFYEGEKLKLLKRSLKTPEGVFNDLIELKNIIINTKINNGNLESNIILSFKCDWDIEHGMGICLVNFKIIEIGGSSEVIWRNS